MRLSTHSEGTDGQITETGFELLVSRLASAVAAAIIIVIPFHAFLTVWASTAVGHYTLLRLWKECLLALLLCVVLAAVLRRVVVARQAAASGRHRTWPVPLWLGLILAYAAWIIIGGGFALAVGEVSPRAYAYGVLLDLRFLAFYGLVRLGVRHRTWLVGHWRQAVLIPGLAVVLFAVLQSLALPPAFLGHFGYGSDTIPALSTIDQKTAYQRVQSTLRGPNPLGAYLVVIISISLVSIVRKSNRRSLSAGMLTVTALALWFSYSRSAWIGAVGAGAWLLWNGLTSQRARRLLVAAACLLAVVLGASGYALRDNDSFQNAFLHTDENSRSAASSNSGHLSATLQGLRDIVRQPLGSGAGTAGPASVYNEQPDEQPARISENYYVQIGQEAGIIGLVLFLSILVQTGRALWRYKQLLLPQALLASFIGLSLVNLLAHAWADDTLAYLWWGLAGLVLSPGYLQSRKTHSETLHAASR